jgi:rod shape determining protein RodA
MLYYLRKIDWAVVLPSLALSAIGVFFIADAANYMGSPPPPFANRQLLWFFISFVFYIGAMVLGFKRLKRLAPSLFAVCCALLVAVLICGTSYKGAKRWIALGWFNLQPSEFIKLAFILFMPLLLSNGRAKKLKFVLLFFSVTASIVFLIAAEPDLGTSLLFVPLALTIALTAGVKRRIIVAIVLVVTIAAPLLFNHLRPYQKERILAFTNPEQYRLAESYQIRQAEVAIGSGGLFGKGYGNGTHNALNLLPARHTDFIFSLIAEEWGLVGGVLVLVLLFSLIFLGITTAIYANSEYGRLVALGVSALLFFQTVVSIAMNLGLAPVTGIPLPFLTYGGSSMILCWSSVASLSLVRLNDKPSLVEYCLRSC